MRDWADLASISQGVTRFSDLYQLDIGRTAEGNFKGNETLHQLSSDGVEVVKSGRLGRGGLAHPRLH